MRLSIIIPYYNAEPYTSELLDVLANQMTSNVECLVIDDGSTVPFTTSYEWVKIIRKDNGGPASARNKGIELTTGEYISFIDADDMVSDCYVEKIIQEIDRTHADVIDLSWKSLGNTGIQHDFKLNTPSDRLKNPSVCTRVFRRMYLGNNRFNENKDATEDEDFSRKVGYLEPTGYTHSAITDYMYFYRTYVEGSNVKSFKAGMTKTKRIVYYYNKVTKDMTWLLEEIKKEDVKNEVILLTNYNEIPELKRYCQISKPTSIWGHTLRGEAFSKFRQIEEPVKAKVILYCDSVTMVSGITTFLYNTCRQLQKEYDLLLLYERFDPFQSARFSNHIRMMKNNPDKKIVCNTIILNRLTDKIPKNVIYKKSVQICHACKQPSFTIPKNRDYIVSVSTASKITWGESAKESIVIHNMSFPEADELMLVSATRVTASDKGNNDNRMRILADMLNKSHIPFVWLNFSDKALSNPPKNFINMGARVNIQNFIKRADYLVQLSDAEAYSMSVLEALTLNTAVIATPFPSLFEQGFVDGGTGYVVPYDMNFDVKKLLRIPEFEFSYDNETSINQWKEIIDAPVPNKKRLEVVDTDEDLINVLVLRSFIDKYSGRVVSKGYTTFSRQRVMEILEAQKAQKVRLIEVCL